MLDASSFCVLAKTDGFTFCALQLHIVRGCPVALGYVKTGCVIIRTNVLASPMDVPSRFSPSPLHTYATVQHHLRVKDRRLIDELLSWPFKGKLFRTTPAHILAANPSIWKDLVGWLHTHHIEVKNLDDFLEWSLSVPAPHPSAFLRPPYRARLTRSPTNLSTQDMSLVKAGYGN